MTHKQIQEAEEMSIQGIQNNMVQNVEEKRRMAEQGASPMAAGEEKAAREDGKQPRYDEYIPGAGKQKPKKAEKCTADTSKVDREIERLKKKKGQLEKQIHSAKDEKKIKALEKELQQVEKELQQKDNDGYRRQHTVFS